MKVQNGNISDPTRHFTDLRRHCWEHRVPLNLRRLIWQIAVTAKYISAKIHESNRKLAGIKNIYGEEQMVLDRATDEILMHQLEYSGFVKYYASEEQAKVITVNTGPDAKYFVAADPLDGSSLVDVNLAIGTIIGIYEGDIMKPARESLVASMAIVYGPLITLAYTAGNGSHEFVLNREGEYVLSEENIKMKDKGKIYGTGGLRRDWSTEHTNWIGALEQEGYKVRYSGAFVADVNHIMIKGGGVYAYPALRNNPDSKMRLIFELQPMAYLIEQAGGIATNGHEHILDIKPKALDQRSPIYIGSKYEVEKAREMLR
ncbi:MAG: fructose-1,6-bisphosphatase [Candidatus Lokiarchaeota archaeon]|nr:fructose-1,6-bisphosphatase [Candidatus Lokiarchaeota archaeon]